MSQPASPDPARAPTAPRPASPAAPGSPATPDTGPPTAHHSQPDTAAADDASQPRRHRPDGNKISRHRHPAADQRATAGQRLADPVAAPARRPDRPGGHRPRLHPDGPLTVTFTDRASRTTIHPATMDGLWAAAVTGHYTAAHCHTPAAASARQLMPVTSRPPPR